jgi:peptide chain release factor subunit 3
MSRLNAGAFEFVPGKSFGAPRAPPAIPPPPEPVDRPLQTEAPPPAPTITLNIGGSKPSPTPPRAPQTQPPPTLPPPTSKPSTVSLQTSSAVPNASATSSKTFSTAKAKTDTTAIAQEVHAIADQAVVKDLFGDGELD